MIFPFPTTLFLNLCVLTLVIFPKKDPCEFRFAHHLSHVKGSSVNNGISKEDASVWYVSFDWTITLYGEFGISSFCIQNRMTSHHTVLDSGLQDDVEQPLFLLGRGWSSIWVKMGSSTEDNGSDSWRRFEGGLARWDSNGWNATSSGYVVNFQFCY